MLNDFLYKEIINELDFKPLEGQISVIKKLTNFVSIGSNPAEIFLLKGYAGTGKTSIIAALVKALRKNKLKTILAAPTGRAAKVLSNYAQKEAFTIHKKIYRQQSASDGFGKFVLDVNIHKNTIFIIDEASMIANQSYENASFGSGRLLDDLIEYVYSGLACKLILTGDTAQLPPVKLDISPALDKNILKNYNYEVIEIELKEVVRQEQKSGILFNATKLRKILKESSRYENKIDFKGFPKIKLSGFKDIDKINGTDLIESISDAYDKYSEQDTVIICRSNKRANRYNQGIRAQVHYKEDEIGSGDLIMVVKNNYFWAEDYDEIDFIANGDTAEITRISNYTERYGYRFADATLKFFDYKNVEIQAKIILDTLSSDTASLSYEQNKDLYKKIEEDYLNIKNKRNRFKKIKEDPYFNALQIKFAYAVTCHKAQGGQWKKVFIDQGWITEEMINKEFLRWLYTAFTRAENELSLINFKKEFFYDET
ncbi:MAG: ATP-dependent endonuclease [Bacteroidetes bacterium]|nr:MAG: ATP-dependent endonuclease [Bacteroidota bacterium]